MDTAPVTCPSCYEVFEVAVPPSWETPCEVDYDCEVCCRPLRLLFEEIDGEVVASTLGLSD